MAQITFQKIEAGRYRTADNRFWAERTPRGGLWTVTDEQRGLFTMEHRLRDCRDWARIIVAGEARMDRLELVEVENTVGGTCTAEYAVDHNSTTGRRRLDRFSVHRYTNDRGHWYDVEDRDVPESDHSGRYRYAATLADVRFVIATRIVQD